MAHLHDAGEFREGVGDATQPVAVRRGGGEGPRELHEQRAKLPGFAKWPDPLLESLHLLGGPAFLPLVGKAAPQLGREEEAGVLLDPFQPLRAHPRRGGAIEAGVDLDGIEESREIGELGEAAWAGSRIHHSCPIRIGPARSADEDFLCHRSPIFLRAWQAAKKPARAEAQATCTHQLPRRTM